MTTAEFTQHWQRLINRFGGKAMDAELEREVAPVVCAMSADGWARAVGVWIGSRKHTDPPRMAEFREAALAESKRAFERDVQGALNFVKKRAPEEMRRHLRAVLSREYGAVESVAEALEVAKLRRRVGE